MKINKICLTSIVLIAMIGCNSANSKKAEKEPDNGAQAMENPKSILPEEFSKDIMDTTTTSSGLKIVFRKQLNDAKPEKGDLVQVHYNGTLTNGSKFDNSFERGNPFPFALGAGQVIPGWDEGIALLGKGDMATIIVPPNLGYGNTTQANGLIPANSTLIFDVHLVDFKAGHKKYSIDGLKANVTASGLKYYIIEQGDMTKKAINGQTAVTNYAGYLTNGEKFDASFDRDEPIEVPLGQGMVIKGWEEVLLLMGVGTKLQVNIPPALGYGSQAKGPIPPNSTLIFDMELVEIK